jgi:endothelin-converting enzyme
MNMLNFPAAIMQSPVFHPDYPAYLNFGGIGYVIGHEISHEFDSSGARFDPDGHRRQWWDTATVAEFTRRSQCYIDQYNNFTFEGTEPGLELHVNGAHTLNENMADGNGIVGAFRAWQTYRKAHPDEDFDMPGLEHFSHEQLFFISASLFYCSAYTPRGKIVVNQQDVHPMENFRLLGMMDNSVEFKEAFQCKDKKARCSTWMD